MADADQLDRLAAQLRDARQIVVLTGAGISTESGIPDFRGPQGVWTKDPAAERKANIQHYVRIQSIRRDVWRNRAGSELLRGRAQRGPPRARRARAQSEGPHARDAERRRPAPGRGLVPAIVIEIHGTVHEVKCLQCGWRGPMHDTLERVRAGEEDPACLECGGILKSATISFGENLVPEDLLRAQRAAEGADVFLAVGTSLGVYPAAALPEQALRAGATLAILNGEPTPFDDVADFVFRDRLGEVLPALVERI